MCFPFFLVDDCMSLLLFSSAFLYVRERECLCKSEWSLEGVWFATRAQLSPPFQLCPFLTPTMLHVLLRRRIARSKSLQTGWAPSIRGPTSTEDLDLRLQTFIFVADGT